MIIPAIPSGRARVMLRPEGGNLMSREDVRKHAFVDATADLAFAFRLAAARRTARIEAR